MGAQAARLRSHVSPMTLVNTAFPAVFTPSAHVLYSRLNPQKKEQSWLR